MEHDEEAPDRFANIAFRCIQRYQRSYAVTDATWMVGIFLMVGAALMLIHSVYNFSKAGADVRFLGVFLYSTAISALLPFLAGLGAMVLASLLRCSTDSVVQTSPFLNDEQRARMMGLK